MLAALGGALTAPTISVQPGIAAEVIVLGFAVVVIGGLGSLGGAALGAVIVGLVRALGGAQVAGGRAVQRLRRDGRWCSSCGPRACSRCPRRAKI